MKQTIKDLPDETRSCLKEVKTEEILQKRIGTKPTVIVKDGKIYYILKNQKKNNSIKHIFGEHLCSKCDFAKGGLCPKIFDLPQNEAEKHGYNILEAVIDSKRIEKYTFITRGVELFNAEREYFIVSECTRYQPVKPEENLQADKENLRRWKNEIKFQRFQEIKQVQEKTRISHIEIF